MASVRQDLADEISAMLDYQHNIDMIGVLFGLRDEFGFGRTRLIRAIRRACDHAERMKRDHADVDEMLDILKAETGIEDDDLTWDVEIEI